MEGVLLDELRGLHQTAIWVFPQLGEHDPVVDHYRQEFGVDLAAHPPGLGPTRLVHMPVTFPKFEGRIDRLGSRSGRADGQG